MLGRLARWLREWAVVAVATWLAWEQVANRLPQWSLYAVLGGVAILALITLPLGVNDDGSTFRIISKVSGRNNSSVISGDQSPVSGNVIVAGKRHTVVVVTAAEARQISNDTGRNELMRDTKAITMPDARAAVDETLNERFGELTDMLIDRINVKDAHLFNRFADPRYIAPLGSAHRTYAETGSKQLGETLSGLLAELAAQPVGSRREIFPRQAVEVTRVLTIEHVNSLAVKLFITDFMFAEPYDTDMLIHALDTLLSPYYGRIPTSRWDYQYMSSTGVCEDGQFGAWAREPYQALYKKYRNSMYPALRTADLKGKFLSEDGPYNEESERLLLIFAESEDDVRVTDRGTLISQEGARFRVAPDRVAKVLGTTHDAEKYMTEAEKELRAIVLARTISLDDFKKRISESKPALATLLDTIQKTGALHFPMQPVGFVLAQHEMNSRAPQLATLIDKIFDDEG
ncbi:hypothetical protein MSIMFI_00762 [Mycobacterium simulans]|uniref:LPO_1073/Vpar_1526 family protein n=1 Tax=Mycobacterium simulans TaxID=627089 RepID=UPI00174D2D3B|nr:hypothetical protein MSIMFI_00762 [Mycobacterium simulans]